MAQFLNFEILFETGDGIDISNFADLTGFLVSLMVSVTLLVYSFHSMSCRRVSVRLSQVGVLLQCLNVGSRKQRRTIVEGL